MDEAYLLDIHICLRKYGDSMLRRINLCNLVIFSHFVRVGVRIRVIVGGDPVSHPFFAPE